ncbi:DUF1985 domain-containing protein [Abeliophyllum distichum]|uniref:DUF1985 domain-containing protein n=1 Tax=Abeliophyllum distichum TaxID=126358 RepID=A0ABD1V201_9LAMI
MEYFVDRNLVTKFKVSLRSTLLNIDAVYDALDDEYNTLFLNSCFGKLYNPGDEAEYKTRIVQDGWLLEKYFEDGSKITPSCLYEVFDNEEVDMGDKYKLGLACIYESVLRVNELNTKIDGHILDLVDDLDLFNQYPWGGRIYDLTRYAFMRSLEDQKEKYSLWGFPLAVQVIVTESKISIM